MNLINKYFMKLIISLLLISCSQGYLQYKNSEFNYSLSYKKGWNQQIVQGVTAFFVEKENSLFKTNINIVVQDLSNQPLTLEEYHKITLDQISNNIGLKNIKTQKDIILSDVKAKELVYTIPKSINNPNELKLKQVYLIKNGKAYLITYTSTISNYDKYLKSSNIFFNTFKILKKKG